MFITMRLTEQRARRRFESLYITLANVQIQSHSMAVDIQGVRE
jgi:hypothetical protein